MTHARVTGPLLITLVDGSLAFSDSPEAMHEAEAKALNSMPAWVQRDHLFDIENRRGPKTVAALKLTMELLAAKGGAS